MIKPIILGCAGLTLTDAERHFFAATQPFGFILFQRNCADPAQVKALSAALRACVERADAPVFIDQEGGRVARLKPPHWLKLPALRPIGALYERDMAQGIAAMKLHAKLTAQMLRALGINGNCAPVLDLFIEGASSAIGDRAISRDPEIVAALGKVIVAEFLANGVLPVIKHLPGHGRVKVDPHYVLPVVDTDIPTLTTEDFVPFMRLRNAPIGMNCHVMFTAIDGDHPVSMSAKAHREVIRGTLGFEGLLFSDDLAMKALDLPLPERGVAAIKAGADIVLYCSGEMNEMEQMAPNLPAISNSALVRWHRAQIMVKTGVEDGPHDSECDALWAMLA